jgi:hypothetical protein
MAKKSRRSRRTKKKRAPAPPPGVRPEVALQSSQPRDMAAPSTTSRTRTVDFSKEYYYVYSDLKRIAILAASMLVVLVALSFVIK